MDNGIKVQKFELTPFALKVPHVATNARASSCTEHLDVSYESIESCDTDDEILGTETKQQKRALMRIASICGIALSFLLFFLAFARYREAMLGQGTLSKSFTFKQMTHSDTPKDLWGSVSKPYPTGAFWTNLVVKTGDSPAAVLPYGVKTVEAGVQVSYGATRRMVTQYAISDNFVADLQLSATQAYQSRAVESFDSLSVTMAYKLTGNGKYRTHLVKGSPFVTVVYDNATPVISAGLMRILDLQSMVVKGSTGSQYIVTLGNFQKWLVYCSEPVAFTWNNDALTAPSTIKGVVRVAILPLQNVDAAFNLLLKHASRYPTGATMTIAHPNNAISEITFNYKTEGAGSLMMLALPHHVSSMTFPVVHNSTHGSYHPIYSIKGKMKTIIGDMWKMQMNMPTVGWNYQLADKLTISELDEIAKNLITDVKNGLPDAVDPYTFGKQIGRMAQLALIADNLGIADVRQQAISNLQQSLTPWITGMNADTLVYDKTYGGMVTVNGLADAMADFGSGWYSDHHFHYGYFVFAASVIARFDSANFEPNRGNYDALVRDICNIEADNDFPYARHKDFYDGHSWASGLFSQANGKGQESSSEATNAYYACYLYGLATANIPLQQHSHTLLSLEIQAAQTYWHISDDSIYDDLFATGAMAGNVGGLDVTASTWFGNQPEYVHGINILPLTPATASLFDIDYVKKQWPIIANRLPSSSPSTKPVSKACSKNPQCASLGMDGDCCPSPDGQMLACCEGQNVEDSSGLQAEWKALLYAMHAVVDRDAAWTEISNTEGFGVGGSKSNSLFWAASRAPPLTHYDEKPAVPDLEASIKPACISNSACDAIGMIGECCPSDTGTSLGCCPRIV